VGKRTRAEPVAEEYPIVVRRGWLHMPDGDVLRVRELLGNNYEKYIGTHPDTGCHGGWQGVPIIEYPLIEWNEPRSRHATRPRHG
jgi:hypothetical protein